MNFLVNRIWYTARASLHHMPVVRVAAPQRHRHPAVSPASPYHTAGVTTAVPERQ